MKDPMQISIISQDHKSIVTAWEEKYNDLINQGLNILTAM